MNPERTVDIDAAFELGTPIDEAMHEAFLDAVRLHQQAGLPLVMWRDGEIEYIPADSINTNPLPAAEASGSPFHRVRHDV